MSPCYLLNCGNGCTSWQQGARPIITTKNDVIRHEIQKLTFYYKGAAVIRLLCQRTQQSRPVSSLQRGTSHVLHPKNPICFRVSLIPRIVFLFLDEQHAYQPRFVRRIEVCIAALGTWGAIIAWLNLEKICSYNCRRNIWVARYKR